MNPPYGKTLWYSKIFMAVKKKYKFCLLLQGLLKFVTCGSTDSTEAENHLKCKKFRIFILTVSFKT